MKKEIAQLRLKLDDKDLIIKQKDLIIDDLRFKYESLLNKEIKDLRQIIEEKENLIKINNEQSSTLQTLENNFIQMKEASLISDLMYELYSHFILRLLNIKLIN